MLPLAPPAACISLKRLLFEDAAISTKDYEMDQPPTVISSSAKLYHKHLYKCTSFCKRKYNFTHKIKFPIFDNKNSCFYNKTFFEYDFHIQV